MIIRQAQEDDLPAIRDVLVETWHATYDSILGASKVDEITARWHTLPRLRQMLGAPDSLTLVAEREQGIIATLSASADVANEVTLNRLYVVPSAQGSGAGTALFNAMLHHFAQAKRVSLEVEPRNAGAIAFYEKHGFQRIGQGRACGGDVAAALEHLIMEKRLP